VPTALYRRRSSSTWRAGTTLIVFEPLDFVARLAALVPRPRAHSERVSIVEREACPNTTVYYATARFSRSAFAITDTDDRLIAAPAIIGESTHPNAG